jgi:hypothetical protein
VSLVFAVCRGPGFFASDCPPDVTGYHGLSSVLAAELGAASAPAAARRPALSILSVAVNTCRTAHSAHSRHDSILLHAAVGKRSRGIKRSACLDAWFVLLSKDARSELSSTADIDFLKDRFEMILHRVG